MILLPGMRFRSPYGGADDFLVTEINLGLERYSYRRLGVHDGYVGSVEHERFGSAQILFLRNFHQIRGLNHVPTR
jgi:hypothetical protein